MLTLGAVTLRHEVVRNARQLCRQPIYRLSRLQRLHVLRPVDPGYRHHRDTGSAHAAHAMEGLRERGG